MTEENGGPTLPAARVATRPGASGIAEYRRRLYQRHLALFLAVNLGLLAADWFTSPGLQWGHFLAVPWGLVFLLHTSGLKSRGYSFGELFIPPRDPPVREVYTVFLDYELVRARQLRDGVVTAAAALRDKNRELSESAAAAADVLLAAAEGAIQSVRAAKTHKDEQAQKLLPEAQAALEVLDTLHQELIRMEVMEDPPETAAIEPVQERAAALRQLI
ncbi:MAG: 2TM domain-containing protein [Gemmatimonadota bacterium]|nr:MAG: 2TM domain-containing protein [Gemmatimonadota bacterium]